MRIEPGPRRAATKRTARAREIIGYVAMAGDVIAGVMGKLTPYL